MIWTTVIFFLCLGTGLTENVCRYSSLANPPLPTIVEHRMPPPGPPGEPQTRPCGLPNQCDPLSCSFSFYRSPYSCDSDCSCVNPCNSMSCYAGQVCVVVRGTDAGFGSMCVTPPEPSKCPKIFCASPPCQYGTEVDSIGCQTCECKNPCKDFGCAKNTTCQLLRLTAGSQDLTPKCVECPSLVNCFKVGVCKAGLKKDPRGCDVCECQECQCTSNTNTNTNTLANTTPMVYDQGFGSSNQPCGDLQCGDSLLLNASSGCDVCQCEPLPCWDKCGAREVCQKRYTRDYRLYGVCVPATPTCPNVTCYASNCAHGVRVDEVGCLVSGCPCKNPCDNFNCPANTYCQSTACPIDSPSCSPAKCIECPDTQKCTTQCVHGRLLDGNGCGTCECRRAECNEDASCKQGMYCNYGKAKSTTTGCDICLCASSPCEPSPCNEGESCSAAMQGDRHISVCLKLTTIAPVVCPAVSCDHVKCVFGLRRDADDCVLPACLCKDFCQGYQCPAGEKCVVLDTCSEANCRDKYLRTCIPNVVDPITSVATDVLPKPTTAPPLTPRQPQFCGDVVYCARWCTKDFNVSANCFVCNCPAKPDYCVNFPCSEGKKCIMTEDDCTQSEGCRDAPMPMCVDIQQPPVSTLKPLCSVPACELPCTLTTPPNSCPSCQCPLSCETAQCGTGKECMMKYQANCYSTCPKIPKCVDERPVSCKVEKSAGNECGVMPVKQWYWDQTNLRCDFFFYSGCEGTLNRFPSRESCTSACHQSLYQCPVLSCSLQCLHGLKLDENACKTCQCVEPCEEITCSSSSMTCKVQALPCPASQPQCQPIFVPSCVCQKKAACNVVCPYGMVKDKGGCDTCDCYDPCQNKVCAMGLLCAIVEHEKCNRSSCRTEVEGECLDAIVKRHIRFIVNASYEINVRDNQDAYNRNLISSISSLYKVPDKNVHILKHEKGSIISTAEVMSEKKEDFADVNDGSFWVNVGDNRYKASILEGNNRVFESTPSSRPNLLLIILCSVLIPLFILLLAVLVCIIVKCTWKRKFFSTRHHILNSYQTESLDKLSSAPPFTTEASKEMPAVQVEPQDVGAKAQRMKSFTDA